MNESEFELQLRGLRPARPSRELEERIDDALAPLQSDRTLNNVPEMPVWWERLLPGLGWAAVGAAAAVITMLSLNLAKGGSDKQTAPPVANIPLPPHPETPAPVNGDEEGEKTSPTAVHKVVTENGATEAINEGIWEGGTTGVGRRVRYSTVERRSWTDTDGAVMIVEMPREDVVMVPVSFQ